MIESKVKNELFISVAPSGYIYFETSHASIGSAMLKLNAILNNNGINIDNLEIDKVELRDSDGRVLSSMQSDD